MRFGLSETQKLLQESVMRFGEKQIPATALRNFEGYGALQESFDELGIGSVLVPEKFDGASGAGTCGTLLDIAIVQMALGQFAAPIKLMSSAALLPLALKEGGSPKQQETYFPKLLSGELKPALALEQGGVELNGNKLTGEKAFVLDIDKANIALVSVRDKVFLVPLGKAQTEVKITHTIDKTRQFGKLLLNGADAEPLTLSASRLITAAQILLAADMVGTADSMLAQALEYAKGRAQFGRVIASFQAVKHACAEMAAALEPCRSMIWFAAHSFDDEPESAALNGLLTKAHVSKVARFVARTSVEVFGGMGFTDEANLHFWFKRIGVDYQMLGQPDALLEEAATLQFDTR